MNKIDLNNRVAIVTGGAQGFGFSMVKRFSESGATVIIWDKDIKIMESLSLPNNTQIMQVDITTYEDIKIAANEVLKKFNQQLSNHKNLETVLLPIRDGISLSVKI